MKDYSSVRLRILVLALALAVVGGCGSRAGSRVAPPAIPSGAAQKAVELYDTDKSGFLDATELEKTPGLRAGFIDAGKVTAEDIAVRIADWNRKKFGRLLFFFTVTHNGKPLQGATVTFVPEPFLGSEIQPATGTTDESGRTMPTAPITGTGAAGVSPGFYRVEITKAGENIPAKYNTETILGMEVPVMEESKAIYDLKY